MSVDSAGGSPVNIERFARVFVKGPEELPSGADTYYHPDRGYYFKLHLDDVTATEATPLIEKAQERFDVELVRRVMQDGFYKERIYIDRPSEAPDGYKVNEGPAGGLYYETGVQEVGVPEGSDTRNVAVIHWEDVEVGDEIVFETPDGDENFAEITGIAEQSDEADAIQVEHDGEAYEAVPGTYTVDNGDEKSFGRLDVTPAKSEGSLTSGTSGVHSARYSPTDDEDDDDDEEKSLFKQGVWTYYVGPEGGEGWMNIETGEVRYQKQRPGEAPEDGDGYGDWLGEGWSEPPDDLRDLQSGQVVEVLTEEGEYVEGTVDLFDQDDGEFAQIDLGPGEGNALVGPAGDDELTAVEEINDTAVDGEFEVGDEVRIHTENLPEGHPDYIDEEGVIEDTVVVGGEKYYDVVDENGITINEFPGGDLEPLDGEDESEGSGDVLEDGDTVEINWEEQDVGSNPDAEVEYKDGELGFRIDGGMYDGAWVHEDEVAEVYGPDGETIDIDGGDDDDGYSEQLEGEGGLSDEEEAFLDEHNLNVGDQILVDGHSAIVQGALSLYTDGEISHVDVEMVDSGDSMNVHPNMIDDAFTSPPETSADEIADEPEGNAPDEEETSSAVAEPVSEPQIIDESLNTADPGEFTTAVEEFAENNPDLAPMLTFHDEEELSEHDVFLSENGDAGVAVDPEGDIQNVFSAEGAEVDGDVLMEQAFEAGGQMLDCYDGFLTDFYQSHGFDVTGTMDFNPEFAPDGWDENPHLEGQPDVMFMAHEPGDVGEVPTYDGSEWDEAKDDSRRAAGAGADGGAEGEAVGGGELGPDSGSGEDGGDDDGVGFDPTEYSPDKVDEWRDMSTIGANHGNSVSAMEVAVMPDGTEMVHKDVDHHTVEESDITRELIGYEASKYLDDNVPAHAANVDEGWAASEVAPGVDAKDATQTMKDQVTEEDFAEMAATQLIIGNSDLHQNNVRVDEDGNLYPFDLDRAGGDLQGDWVGKLDQYENTLDRIFGELEKSAMALDVDIGPGFREYIIEQAEEQAKSLTEEDVFGEMYDDITEVDTELGDVIADNILALTEGEVSPP